MSFYDPVTGFVSKKVFGDHECANQHSLTFRLFFLTTGDKANRIGFHPVRNSWHSYGLATEIHPCRKRKRLKHVINLFTRNIYYEVRIRSYSIIQQFLPACALFLLVLLLPLGDDRSFQNFFLDMGLQFLTTECQELFKRIGIYKTPFDAIEAYGNDFIR